MKHEHPSDQPEYFGQIDLDTIINHVSILANEHEDADQLACATEEVANNLRLLEKKKALELSKARQQASMQIAGRYERGEIDWRECLEVWGKVNSKDTSELATQLSQVAPQIPIIDYRHRSASAYISNGNFNLFIGRSPARIEAFVHLEGYPEDNNSLSVSKETFVGQNAITSRLDELLELEHQESAHYSITRFIQAAEFSYAAHELNVELSIGLREKFHLKLLEVIALSITNNARFDAPHLSRAALHEARVNQDGDTTAIDMLLASKLISDDSISFQELGAALDIAEKGAASKYLIDKDTLTPEQKILLMAGAREKAFDRRLRLTDDQG